MARLALDVFGWSVFVLSFGDEEPEEAVEEAPAKRKKRKKKPKEKPDYSLGGETSGRSISSDGHAGFATGSIPWREPDEGDRAH